MKILYNRIITNSRLIEMDIAESSNYEHIKNILRLQMNNEKLAGQNMMVEKFQLKGFLMLKYISNQIRIKSICCVTL